MSSHKWSTDETLWLVQAHERVAETPLCGKPRDEEVYHLFQTATEGEGQRSLGALTRKWRNLRHVFAIIHEFDRERGACGDKRWFERAPKWRQRQLARHAHGLGAGMEQPVYAAMTRFASRRRSPTRGAGQPKAKAKPKAKPKPKPKAKSSPPDPEPRASLLELLQVERPQIKPEKKNEVKVSPTKAQQQPQNPEVARETPANTETKRSPSTTSDKHRGSACLDRSEHEKLLESTLLALGLRLGVMEQDRVVEKTQSSQRMNKTVLELARCMPPQTESEQQAVQSLLLRQLDNLHDKLDLEAEQQKLSEKELMGFVCALAERTGANQTQKADP